MNEFESKLNSLLVDTFNYILKYESMSLKAISGVPVTSAEAHIIEAIAKNGESATVSQIASTLKVSMPTATVAIKKLACKGFVRKVPCTADGRRFIISLTELGNRVNKAHGIFHTKMVRNISSCFSDGEKAVLLSAISKLSEFFKRKVEA